MGLFTRIEETCVHLWGKVIDGYQYCSKCGLARVAGCAHDWREESVTQITRVSDKSNIGTETIYICKKCTQRKFVRTELGKEPLVKMI